MNVLVIAIDEDKIKYFHFSSSVANAIPGLLDCHGCMINGNDDEYSKETQAFVTNLYNSDIYNQHKLDEVDIENGIDLPSYTKVMVVNFF